MLPLEPTVRPETPPVAAGIAAPAEGEALELPGLHNVRQFAPGVWSGSMPHGAAGFDSLRAMGIRSVVSVDAAVPDVDATTARGMRYVHIPIQYSGIDHDDRAAVAKAVRDLPRPLYLHCHHGKHRGPAALAVGLVGAGEIDAQRGVELMRQAGTSSKYSGLYACVEAAGPLNAAHIDTYGGSLPERAEVGGFAGAMAAADRHWDHLTTLKAHRWAPPPDHPDLVALNEAGLVHDYLRVCAEDAQYADAQQDFLDWMRESVAASAELERAIEAQDADRADLAHARLAASCTGCHKAYRDE